MKTINEINDKYKAIHTALGTQKDAPDKAKFNNDHRALWSSHQAELSALRVILQAKGAGIFPAEQADLDILNWIMK